MGRRRRAGEAACEMTRGDWLAAPATSPVAWNFILKEGLSGNDLALIVPDTSPKFFRSPKDLLDASDEAPIITRDGRERMIGWRNTNIHDERGTLVCDPTPERVSPGAGRSSQQ